jgi:hypothetical protein
LTTAPGGAEPEVLLQDRLKKGKERLDHALEAITLLCDPVEPPQGELEHNGDHRPRPACQTGFPMDLPDFDEPYDLTSSLVTGEGPEPIRKPSSTIGRRRQRKPDQLLI